MGLEETERSSGVPDENRAVKKTAVNERGTNNRNVHQAKYSGGGNHGRPGEHNAFYALVAGPCENTLDNCHATTHKIRYVGEREFRCGGGTLPRAGSRE